MDRSTSAKKSPADQASKDAAVLVKPIAPNEPDVLAWTERMLKDREAFMGRRRSTKTTVRF
jgi:hypothetical protein